MTLSTFSRFIWIIPIEALPKQGSLLVTRGLLISCRGDKQVLSPTCSTTCPPQLLRKVEALPISRQPLRNDSEVGSSDSTERKSVSPKTRTGIQRSPFCA